MRFWVLSSPENKMCIKQVIPYTAMVMPVSNSKNERVFSINDSGEKILMCRLVPTNIHCMMSMATAEITPAINHHIKVFALRVELSMYENIYPQITIGSSTARIRMIQYIPVIIFCFYRTVRIFQKKIQSSSLPFFYM